MQQREMARRLAEELIENMDEVVDKQAAYFRDPVTLFDARERVIFGIAALLGTTATETNGEVDSVLRETYAIAQQYRIALPNRTNVEFPTAVLTRFCQELRETALLQARVTQPLRSSMTLEEFCPAIAERQRLQRRFPSF